MTKHFFFAVFLFIQIGLLSAEQPDSVFNLQTRSFPKLAIPVMTVTTAGAFLLDTHVRKHLQNNPSSFRDHFSEISDIGGEKTIIVPAVAASYAAGRWVLKDPKLQLTAFQSAQSIFATAIITEGIKISAGRARPFTNEGPRSFHPFSWSDDQHKSFPSGHTSLAFAAFTPFAENYSRWLYAIPVSVAAGRVWQDNHWTSDVVVGSCIGFISGFLFTHNENVQLMPHGVVVKF